MQYTFPLFRHWLCVFPCLIKHSDSRLYAEIICTHIIANHFTVKQWHERFYFFLFVAFLNEFLQHLNLKDIFHQAAHRMQ
ncbi:hypothetical protein G966_01506 [Escherichia coli UMEA 3323-1]|nr:hypothetical protein G966_01506 [Escherichia coli UMEA 3323-1]